MFLSPEDQYEYSGTIWDALNFFKEGQINENKIENHHLELY